MQALSFLNPLFNDVGKKLKFIARIVLIAGLALTMLFTIINFVQAGIAGGDGPKEADYKNKISANASTEEMQNVYKQYAKDSAHHSYLQAQGSGHFVFVAFLTLVLGAGGTLVAALGLHALGGIAEKHVENEEVVARPAPAYNAPQYPQYNAAPQQAAPQTTAQSFCDGCGAPLEPGTMFCGACGKKQG